MSLMKGYLKSDPRGLPYYNNDVCGLANGLGESIDPRLVALSTRLAEIGNQKGLSKNQLSKHFWPKPQEETTLKMVQIG